MNTYNVKMTRDCRSTQSGITVVKANTPEEARVKAHQVYQEDIDWTDDDDYFCPGENGTYIADPVNDVELAAEPYEVTFFYEVTFSIDAKSRHQALDMARDADLDFDVTSEDYPVSSSLYEALDARVERMGA